MVGKVVAVADEATWPISSVVDLGFVDRPGIDTCSQVEHHLTALYSNCGSCQPEVRYCLVVAVQWRFCDLLHDEKNHLDIL